MLISSNSISLLMRGYTDGLLTSLLLKKKKDNVRKPRCPKWRTWFFPGRKDVLTGLPEGSHWQRERMVLSDWGLLFSLHLLFFWPFWGGRAAVSLVVILFSLALNVPRGPIGINYQYRYRSRTWGWGWGGCSSKGWGFGGDPIMCRCSAEIK